MTRASSIGLGMCHTLRHTHEEVNLKDGVCSALPTVGPAAIL
jgi:hypothetical protein